MFDVGFLPINIRTMFTFRTSRLFLPQLEHLLSALQRVTKSLRIFVLQSTTFLISDEFDSLKVAGAAVEPNTMNDALNLKNY